MGYLQTFSLVVGLPGLAMGVYELTRLAVARVVWSPSIERRSWIPFQLRLGLDGIPSEATLRMIAVAPLLVGSVAAVIAVQTGVWQRIEAADPYSRHYLGVAYCLLYVAPSAADLRPPTEGTLDVGMAPQ